MTRHPSKLYLESTFATRQAFIQMIRHHVSFLAVLSTVYHCFITECISPNDGLFCGSGSMHLEIIPSKGPRILRSGQPKGTLRLLSLKGEVQARIIWPISLSSLSFPMNWKGLNPIMNILYNIIPRANESVFVVIGSLLRISGAAIVCKTASGSKTLYQCLAAPSQHRLESLLHPFLQGDFLNSSLLRSFQEWATAHTLRRFDDTTIFACHALGSE